VGTVERPIGGNLAARLQATMLGTAGEHIVFSHGFGTDQTAWGKIAAPLSTGARCVLFDLPGASPLMPADFDERRYRSIAGYADDLLDLLDELEITRCTYVGHSVSAMVGVLASIEAPGRFSKLVLLNASPRYINCPGYVGGFEPQQIEGLLEAMSSNYQAWVAGFSSLVMPAGLPSALVDFSAGLLSMRPDVSARIARMIFEGDIRHVLPQVKVPTLLLQSREDVAVPAEVATYLLSTIAGAELQWIEAVGHLPHMSAPDRVLEVLRERLH
jgi:sigma-B regulation protein RsbQ